MVQNVLQEAQPDLSRSRCFVAGRDEKTTATPHRSPGPHFRIDRTKSPNGTRDLAHPESVESSWHHYQETRPPGVELASSFDESMGGRCSAELPPVERPGLGSPGEAQGSASRETLRVLWSR